MIVQGTSVVFGPQDEKIVEVLNNLNISLGIQPGTNPRQTLSFYSPRLAEKFVEMAKRGPKFLKRKADYLRAILDADDLSEIVWFSDWFEIDWPLILIITGAVVATGLTGWGIYRLIQQHR